MQDDYCSEINFLPECDYDRNDCACPHPEFIGDTICDIPNNLRRCNYDGLDCGFGCPLNLALYIGNGVCNTNANTSKCLYDGGDCLWINLFERSVIYSEFRNSISRKNGSGLADCLKDFRCQKLT